MDGIFTITIRNNADIDREAIYSEIWPWWVKGWISEMQVRIDGQIQGKPQLWYSTDARRCS
jgi:phosphatidylinositol glycan class T